MEIVYGTDVTDLFSMHETVKIQWNIVCSHGAGPIVKIVPRLHKCSITY